MIEEENIEEKEIDQSLEESIDWEYRYDPLTRRTIQFNESTHRVVELISRLHFDKFNRNKFFRDIITAYLNRDEDFMIFFNKLKDKYRFQSKSALDRIRKLQEKGKKNINMLGLGDEEIENIFDLIEKENF